MCDVIAQSTQNILWQDKSVAVRWINDEINTSRHFVKHSDRRNVSAAVVHRSVIDQSEWFWSWYNYFLFPRSFLLWFLSINFSFYHILSSFHHFVSSSIAGICHLLVFCSWTSRLALSSHFVLGHISVDCPDWFGHVSVCECVWQHVCVCVWMRVPAVSLATEECSWTNSRRGRAAHECFWAEEPDLLFIPSEPAWNTRTNMERSGITLEHQNRPGESWTEPFSLILVLSWFWFKWMKWSFLTETDASLYISLIHY